MAKCILFFTWAQILIPISIYEIFYMDIFILRSVKFFLRCLTNSSIQMLTWGVLMLVFTEPGKDGHSWGHPDKDLSHTAVCKYTDVCKHYTAVPSCGSQHSPDTTHRTLSVLLSWGWPSSSLLSSNWSLSSLFSTDWSLSLLPSDLSSAELLYTDSSSDIFWGSLTPWVLGAIKHPQSVCLHLQFIDSY